MPKQSQAGKAGPSGSGTGHNPVTATAPVTTPRHSAAKAQRIKAMDERNMELCKEILELEEIQKLMKSVMTRVEFERRVISKATGVAKESMVMSAEEHELMMKSINESVRKSMDAPRLPTVDELDFEDTEDEKRFPAMWAAYGRGEPFYKG